MGMMRLILIIPGDKGGEGRTPFMNECNPLKTGEPYSLGKKTAAKNARDRIMVSSLYLMLSIGIYYSLALGRRGLQVDDEHNI